VRERSETDRADDVELDGAVGRRDDTATIRRYGRRMPRFKRGNETWEIEIHQGPGVWGSGRSFTILADRYEGAIFSDAAAMQVDYDKRIAKQLAAGWKLVGKGAPNLARGRDLGRAYKKQQDADRKAAQKARTAPKPKKGATPLDVSALPKKLAKFTRAVTANKRATWSEAAWELGALDPDELLPLAVALRDTHRLPAARKPTVLAATHAIVIGDATAKGELFLGSGIRWVVTGNLSIVGRLSIDETALVAVAGNVTATFVDAEGDLRIGGDLTAKVVWAEYEAGELHVGGALKADTLVQHNHVVNASKIAAGAYYRGVSRAACKGAPAAAFEDDRLSVAKLWAFTKKLGRT